MVRWLQLVVLQSLLAVLCYKLIILCKQIAINIYILYNLGKIVDWKKTENDNLDVHLYPGEWTVIDCRLNDSTVNVSLWRSKKKIVPDQRKVMELNQVFNITNLTFNDKGNYYCRACGNKMEKSLGYKDVASGIMYQTSCYMNQRTYKHNINT